jgi:hypothetical protein
MNKNVTVKARLSLLPTSFWMLTLLLTLVYNIMDPSVPFAMRAIYILVSLPIINMIFAPCFKKYSIRNKVLYIQEDTLFESPKAWPLEQLQTVNYISTPWWDQLLACYPAHMIELKFYASDSAQKKVKIRRDDRKLYKHLLSYAKEIDYQADHTSN